jgi:hypothetical protein
VSGGPGGGRRVRRDPGLCLSQRQQKPPDCPVGGSVALLQGHLKCLVGTGALCTGSQVPVASRGSLCCSGGHLLCLSWTKPHAGITSHSLGTSASHYGCSQWPQAHQQWLGCGLPWHGCPPLTWALSGPSGLSSHSVRLPRPDASLSCTWGPLNSLGCGVLQATPSYQVWQLRGF